MQIANKLRYLRKRLKVVRRKDIEYAFRLSKGVVHVGASVGQERALYEKYGLYVLWIEPLPEVFVELQKNIEALPNQRAIRALVSDQDDEEYKLHVADNTGMSSSFLPPKGHRDVWPNIEFKSVMALNGTRLDSLFKLHDVETKRYDCLVLDTQGSELLILMGAKKLLPRFRFIVAEAADFEAYEGCCTDETITGFLATQGFLERLREAYPVSEDWYYYQILFERVGYDQ